MARTLLALYRIAVLITLLVLTIMFVRAPSTLCAKGCIVQSANLRYANAKLPSVVLDLTNDRHISLECVMAGTLCEAARSGTRSAVEVLVQSGGPLLPSPWLAEASAPTGVLLGLRDRQLEYAADRKMFAVVVLAAYVFGLAAWLLPPQGLRSAA